MCNEWAKLVAPRFKGAGPRISVGTMKASSGMEHILKSVLAG